MDEVLGRILAITYPVVIVCGSGLLAWGMKLRHDRRMRVDLERLDELAAQVEALRGDLGQALTEFGERLDFAERLLARVAERAADESKHPTPV